MQIFIRLRDKCGPRVRLHVPNEKSQVENQVFEVPRAQYRMLLRENDFVHANPARAVAHPIRHNDHVIREKEVGLVGLKKQLGLTRARC